MVLLLFILHSPNTPFIKSGMRFYKNGCNGKGGEGGGTFLLEMSRGSQEWGIGFIMGGSIWEIFRFSLHNGGEVLTPLFYEDPLILPTHPPTYFQILFNPLPQKFHVTSNSTAIVFSYSPVSSAECMITSHLMSYFTLR